MTKRIRWVGMLGVAGAVFSICWLSGAQALQSERTPSAAARTRVALLNLHEVFKNYKKVQVFRDQLRAKMETYEEALKNKAKRLEALDKEYRDPTTTAQRKEQIEGEMRAIRFEMDDLRTKGQREVAKLQDEQITTIYLEVDQVVREYCAANGVDLVLRYNEDWDQKTYYNPENVANRLRQPFWPMYYDKSLEITGAVVVALNQRYAQAQPQGGTNVQPASLRPGQK